METKKEYIKREQLLIDLEYEFIEQFIKTRKSENLTQQQLADKANVIRETIARIENQITSPGINTLIKILEPIGYTVKIEKINNKKTV